MIRLLAFYVPLWLIIIFNIICYARVKDKLDYIIINKEYQ